MHTLTHSSSTARTRATAVPPARSQVHECVCTVQRSDAACAHLSNTTITPLRPHAGSYFNAGLLVLRPSRLVLAHMQAALATLDLAACPFGEQAARSGSRIESPWLPSQARG